MNLLLDTHIWIWSKLEPKRLGRRTRAELSDPNNELWLSSVSVWEALVLMQKGRIRVETPFSWVERASEQYRGDEVLRVADRGQLVSDDAVSNRQGGEHRP